MTSEATHLAEVRSDAGSGLPVVFIPGLDGSGELLLGTAARLRAHFRVVCMCYRTHGAPPAQGDQYKDLAKSVVNEMDRLGIERAIILAESFGGAVAFRTAIDSPERVAALAIVNSFAFYRRTLRLAISRSILRVVPPSVYKLCRYLFAPLVLLAPRRDPQAIAEFRTAPLLDLSGGYLRRMKLIGSLEMRSELSRVTQPVHLFASTHDRVLNSVRAAEEMAALLPDAEITILSKAGHVVLPLSEEPWLERLQTLAARSDLR
ncbi:MAG: pimeloyl-ACP methyl ester carboxylesterase [Planctomycetota bacterium]|jgi:pimeloyl-ACP methyl ester carboxylesterase